MAPNAGMGKRAWGKDLVRRAFMVIPPEDLGPASALKG
jgi:hypothetical protein